MAKSKTFLQLGFFFASACQCSPRDCGLDEEGKELFLNQHNMPLNKTFPPKSQWTAVCFRKATHYSTTNTFASKTLPGQELPARLFLSLPTGKPHKSHICIQLFCVDFGCALESIHFLPNAFHVLTWHMDPERKEEIRGRGKKESCLFCYKMLNWF